MKLTNCWKGKQLLSSLKEMNIDYERQMVKPRMLEVEETVDQLNLGPFFGSIVDWKIVEWNHYSQLDPVSVRPERIEIRLELKIASCNLIRASQRSSSKRSSSQRSSSQSDLEPKNCTLFS